MDFLSPTSLADALAALAEYPAAVPIAGGTDVMVELNFDRRRPPATARSDPGTRADRLGGPTGRGCGSARLTRTPGLSKNSVSGRRDWPRRHGPWARRRSATGGPSAATWARPRRPGTPIPPLLAAGARVELASVRGVRPCRRTGYFTGHEAQRAGGRRAGHGGARAGGTGAAAVREGRYPQRDGDRGVLGGGGAGPVRQAIGTGIGSAARRRGARRCRGGPGGRAGLGRPGSAARSGRGAVRGTGSPPLRHRSTMCGVPRRTGGTPWRCWAGGPDVGVEGPGGTMRVTCVINGEPREADDVWPGESLLYVLRERLGLPGAKNACEQGECGSCTLYLDGLRCAPAWVAAGRRRAAR